VRGAAAAIAPAISERAFDLRCPVDQVTGCDVAMPYGRNLELLTVPHEADVIAAVRRSLYGDRLGP
jgi:pyruvate dehydrogenase E1 component beta subunit